MPLTKKEKDFCTHFCFCKNPREAAAKAGFKFPESKGLKLLSREEIKQEIASETYEFERLAHSADGLRRIAFGSVADAVKLAVFGAESVNIEELDLFSVSEIKIPKGGGMEIKFYDRIKALEALADISRGSAEDDTAPFIEALVKGSAALERAVRSDDDEF